MPIAGATGTAGTKTSTGAPGGAGAVGSLVAGTTATTAGSDADAGPRDGGAEPAGNDCAPPTAERAPIVNDCTTEVRLIDGAGGFGPTPPEGSTCRGEATYTLDMQSGELTWSQCRVQATDPWQLSEGSRKLTADELDAAKAKLGMVTVWDGRMVCGADKGQLHIEVVTPQGSKRYGDSFYSCYMGIDKTFVDNIDTAFAALSSLAHP